MTIVDKRNLCIRVLGGTGKRYALLEIKLWNSEDCNTFRKREERACSKARNGKSKEEIRRKDGSYIRFDDNRLLLLMKVDK